MKKSILLLGAALSISTASFSQGKGFYLKVAGGYGWAGFGSNETLTAPDISQSALTKDVIVTMVNRNDSVGTYSPVKGSYGTGGNVSGAVGYMFNNWFGLELGANYIFSKSYTSSVLAKNVTPNGTFFIDGQVKTSGQSLIVTPQLVFVADVPKWPVQPYGKFGLALPVMGSAKHSIDINVPAGLQSAIFYNNYYLGAKNHMELESGAFKDGKPTLSLGVSWSVGVRYTPKNLSFISVFVESKGQWLNVKAAQTKISEFTSDGVDRLHNADPTLNRSEYRQVINYVDALNSSSNNKDYNPNYDPNKPKEDMRVVSPFSNIGIQVGIQLNFGKAALESIKKKK